MAESMSSTSTPTRGALIGLELVTEQELGEDLGKSRWTLLRWRSQRRRPLPFVQIGGRVYYKPAAVRRWLEGGAS